MVAMQMMMKLMLIPLLAGMLLGNSPKFQSRSCCSQVFTGYSLSIMNSISLARKKKHHVPGSGMLQTWLRCPLPWGAHLDTCTHHIWERREAPPWVVIVPCAQTYPTTWCYTIIAYLSVSFINDGLQQRHELFFHLSIPKPSNSTK